VNSKRSNSSVLTSHFTLVTFFCLVVLIAGLIYSSVDTHPPADFRFINRGSVHTLDPAQMSYMQDIRLACSLWEGLTTLDPETLEPIPGVAFLPPDISEDGLQLTFRLRPEARWSNGDPVTAHDFVFGWRRAVEPGTAHTYAELISSHIEGMEAYVAWRHDYVATLGLIRQLQKGAPVDAGSISAALTNDRGRHLARRFGIKVADPPPPEDDVFWLDALETLRGASVDWRALGDAMLDAHIAEMDKRFSRVGLRTIDDHTLEVQLSRPTAYFLDIAAFSTYLPIHRSIDHLRIEYEGRPLADTGVWAYDPQWTKPDYHENGYPGLVTNGPFIVKDWVFKRRMRLEKNPYYWDIDNVRSASIEMPDVEYQNTGFMLFEQGQVDMMTDMAMDYTPDLVAAAKAGKRSGIHDIPNFGTYFYTVNCRPRLNDGRPNPLADPRVRQALALAIDKQQLVDHVIRLNNPVARTLIPPDQIPGYESPAGLGYDPERARALLAEAGHPEGEGLPVITILFNTGFDHENPAQAIKRMWEMELGIEVGLVAKESKTFAEDKVEGRFMVARSGWFGDYYDPTTFLDLRHSKNGQNHSGFDDPYYDGLLEKAYMEVDPEERMKILTEAERYLMEEQLPIIPLYVYVSVYAWSPDVVGIYENPRLRIPLKYVGRK
jgi:oligopeptide transport system substrate-binding protein